MSKVLQVSSLFIFVSPKTNQKAFGYNKVPENLFATVSSAKLLANGSSNNVSRNSISYGFSDRHFLRGRFFFCYPSKQFFLGKSLRQSTCSGLVTSLQSSSGTKRSLSGDWFFQSGVYHRFISGWRSKHQNAASILKKIYLAELRVFHG